MPFIRPVIDSSLANLVPNVVSSSLTAQKETEGTAGFSTTVATSSAGLTLLSWAGLLTATYDGTLTANNSNTVVNHFSQDFPSPFTSYSIKGFRTYNASGGSNHSVSGTKTASTSGEVTIALLALSGGTITPGGPLAVNRAAAGAGAIHTSPDITVSTPALLVCIASGTGDVNVTAPTQTWPNDWTVHQSVAFNSAQAPNGHIPFYLATKPVFPGTYNVNVQVTINEGLLMHIFGVSL